MFSIFFSYCVATGTHFQTILYETEAIAIQLLYITTLCEN